MSQRIENASSPAGLWVWLFPLAYGLHIAEEHWLHFPAWVARFAGRFVSSPKFLFLNAFCWLLMVAAVYVIRTRSSRAWLVVTLAAILGINAGCIFLAASSPAPILRGSVTAALLRTFLSSSMPFDRSFRALAVALLRAPQCLVWPFMEASCSWPPIRLFSRRCER